eukprot:g4204.t1
MTTKRPAPRSKTSKPSKSRKTNGGGKWNNNKRSNNTPAPPATKQEKRQQKKQRRLAQPQGELVELLKEKWAKAQRVDCASDVRSQLVKDMLTMMNGKLFMVAQKHDASRIIQTCVQYGTEKQLFSIVNELSSHVVELSKSPYGHHLVKKLLTYCKSKADSSKTKKYEGKAREILLKAFEGQLVRLSFHAIASQVVEYMFDTVFTPAERRWHAQEFYGPGFKFFKVKENGEGESLTNSFTTLLLKEKDMMKRNSMVQHLGSVLKKLAEKGMLRHSFVHDLMYAYFKACENSKIEFTKNFSKAVHDLVDFVKEVSPAMCSTRNGMVCAARCAAAADAKARKKMVKSFKDDIWRPDGQGLCHHVFAHMAAVQLLNVVDDTVLLRKQILAPLYTTPKDGSSAEIAGGGMSGQDRLLDVALHPCAKKLLLQVLAPGSTRIFAPVDLVMLEEGRNAKDEKGNNRSKKSPEQRQIELVKVLKGPLEELILSRASKLISDENGAEVLVAAMEHFHSSQLFDAIANAVVEPDLFEQEKEEDEEEEERCCAIDDAAGHHIVQAILKSCGKVGFASSLLKAMQNCNGKGGLSGWTKELKNRSCFVLAALIQNADGATATVAREELSGEKEKLSKCKESVPGAKVLLSLL